MKKLKLLIFFNNKKGLDIYKKIKKKYIFSKIILSKKNLNIKVLKFLKKNKKKYIIIKKFDKKASSLIKNLQADIFLVCGFPLIFPEKVLTLPKYGTINCHSGPLPKYRGGSPLNWQIINNEKKFGISIIKINKYIDRGNILFEKKFKLKKNYDINDLHRISNKQFSISIPKAIDILISGKNKKKQKEKYSNYFRQRKEEDGLINCRQMNSLQIYNFVRALCNPYPNAFTFYNNLKFKFQKVKISKVKLNLNPGEFLKKNNKTFVKCKKGCIEILKSNRGLPKSGKFDSI
tara:strand:+ start:422 stop:1291 length:870 start_codon:yes stop_codon:yes gene_type:complete